MCCKCESVQQRIIIPRWYATWYFEVHLENETPSTEIILCPGLSWSSRYPTTGITASVHFLRASCQAFAANLGKSRQDTSRPTCHCANDSHISFHSAVGFSYMKYIGIFSFEAETNDELQRLTKHILSLVSVQKKAWCLGVPSGEPGHPPKSGRWWWSWGLPSWTNTSVNEKGLQRCCT